MDSDGAKIEALQCGMLPVHEPGPADVVAENAGRGFENVKTWTRGIDRAVFKPFARGHLNQARPIRLYAGRLAVEKGIKDFLDLEVAGTKVLVGDGPQRAELKAK